MPTYSLERLQDTIEAVSSLLKQSYPENEVVVVVDRDRNLYSRLLEKLPEHVHLRLTNDAGASSARNLGIKEAKGEIVAFIDDDVIVDRDWLVTLVRHYQDPNVISVGGKIKPLWASDSQRHFPKELYWIIGCTYEEGLERVHEVRNNFAGNMSFRGKVFEHLSFSTSCQKIDGEHSDAEKTKFLGKYLETDDTEFYIRVHERFADTKTIYDPKALAYHRIYPYRTSLGHMLRKAFSEGISKAYIACLYSNNIKGYALSKEREYFRSLFTKWVPTRVKEVLKGKSIRINVKSILLVSVVSVTVVAGYLTGSVIYHHRLKSYLSPTC